MVLEELYTGQTGRGGSLKGDIWKDTGAFRYEDLFIHLLRALYVPKAQLVKNLPAMRETWVQFLGWEDPRRRERLHTPVFWPEEFHGLYSPWGRKKLDMTEHLSLKIVMPLGQ